MDKENHGDEDLKNPLAGDSSESAASDDKGAEKGNSNEMVNTENPNEEVNGVSDKDGKDLHEEMRSESLSVQGTSTLDDKEKNQESLPGDSMAAGIFVQDINEEEKGKEQPDEVHSSGIKPPVEEMKNEQTSDDENGNHLESSIAAEAKITETRAENHEDEHRALGDQGVQQEDRTDVAEIHKVDEQKDDRNEPIDSVNSVEDNLDAATETEIHKMDEQKDGRNEPTDSVDSAEDNLDAAAETEKINGASNSDYEVEHLEGETILLPEKLEELLASENEINKPETERGEVVKSENLFENSEVELNAQVENNSNSTQKGQNKDKEKEPVFDRKDVPGMEANRSGSSNSLIVNPDNPSTISETAVAFKNFVKQRSSVAVSTFIQRLSGKKDNINDGDSEFGKGQTEDPKADAGEKKQAEVTGLAAEPETKDLSPKPAERSTWNPLNFLIMSRDTETKVQDVEGVDAEPILPITMKGRIILYTSLGCQECKETRLFLHQKRLGYVEVNIDVYPSRKTELEKLTGSSSVPKIFFNEVLIGVLSDLKSLDESGKLDAKIHRLIAEAPSIEAPLPPLSGEDDESNNGTVDENALFIRKMRESIVVRDRFYGLRRYTTCFLGSDAVNFISEDQYLEREEAIQFGRKLASEFFILHVLEENLFEDGNHLYRFLDQDPIVASQCQNIPRGILDVKPKPITEIASRLRFLQYAMLEAYASDDGRHLDYRSIHGSEEFARYLRTIEELQRVDLQDMPREEKLAFFINLYNMMAIHVILIWGHPTGALERRRMVGDFKYVVGGCTYSLSAIENGILRSNQRPPYNLVKPFGAKDRRAKLVLPCVEPLIHFALVCGTRSGPALRCYSPGNIDKELAESARNFVKTGGLVVDLNNKVVSVSKILKWFSADFGKNETEVLKQVANYLDPPESEAMLELLGSNQLKVTYQPYDWGLNH